jgi:hypothetical protein
VSTVSSRCWICLDSSVGSTSPGSATSGLAVSGTTLGLDRLCIVSSTHSMLSSDSMNSIDAILRNAQHW